MLDRMPARQCAGPGEHGPLRIGGPFRVDLEDGAALLGQALAQRLPEGRPLVEAAVQDGPARRVVQGQTAGKAPPKHGRSPDRRPRVDPEVALNSPAVARLEAAPGPG